MIVRLYNISFWSIFFIIIFSLTYIGITLYLKMKNDEEDDEWYYFAYAIKKKLIEMFVSSLFIGFLILFLYESFSINVMNLLHVLQYWKLIVGIWIVANIISGKKLYDRLNFRQYIRKVKRGEYTHTTPENIMLEIIDTYNCNYALQVERLGILKSLTPISLIPPITGYILEGKNIAVDWNWYTAAFFGILFIYFYNLWKTYKNMQFWKIRTLEIQKEIRDIQWQSKINTNADTTNIKNITRINSNIIF